MDKYISTTHILAEDYCYPICPYCNRTVPDETWVTGNGRCIWCDYIVHEKKPKMITKEQLYQIYSVKKLKIKEIQKIFNCSESTVIRLLKQYNIPKRGFISCHGQKKKDSTGYILVLKPDHPYAQKRGYVPEHRLVMEKHLGRYLSSQEEIHHINEIRDDNRIENLKLCSNRKEHSKYHIRTTKIIQYDGKTKSHIRVWDSIKEASNKLNICASNISNCINFKRATAGGFIWRKIK